ncbi:MAG TPA: S41 family peptidase [Pyrinomonadaceae bacterium]
MNLTKTLTRLFSLIAAIVLASMCALGQQPDDKQPQAKSFDKQRGRDMLDFIKSDLRKNYYDSAYHGMDIDARFKAADEKIKTATSLGQIFGIIAQAVMDLDDSHTFFLPPGRSYTTEYGWQMQMIGDRCFVTAVKPGSDAEVKGLKEGDELWTINDFGPTRENFWKIEYYFNTLRPQLGMKLVVKRPDGKEAELTILAKIQRHKRLMDLTGQDIFELIRQGENAEHFNRQRFVEFDKDLLIWKMPQFDMDEGQVDEIMGRVRKHKALILDLRGNPGGAVDTLQRLAGHFFDHDVKIADLKGRKEMKPQLAKTRGDKTFKGQVVVLIDSRSASAAEIFSRLLQLEKRGTVLGDRSAGAVMQSRHFPHELGIDIVAFWGISITDADVIMADGKSLEKTGVSPDEVILPSAVDLAAGRDPVMARAADLVGIKLEADKAGALFPIEWRK